MNKEFISAINDLEKERGISKDMLFEAIESALASAYKKNYGTNDNVSVDIDKTNGDIHVYMKMAVVGEVVDESSEISLAEAQEVDVNYEIGDYVEYVVTPKDFGRIAAQTAKQVVVQRIREAERGMAFEEFSERSGEVVTGEIQRNSNGTLFINIDNTEGILSLKEQVPGESFEIGDMIKVYIMDVKRTTKGPQVFLSRSHPGLVKRLFELEIPEIEDGVVEIVSIAREAGSRTKLAVYSEDSSVDPVGACVGSRGSRVQNIVDELFNEKIDIISWSEDPEVLISHVLSPAKVEKVSINEEDKIATVVVPDFQLSLAIGKSGQNVRLAAKLCGWKIDIKSQTQADEMAKAGNPIIKGKVVKAVEIEEADETLEIPETAETPEFDDIDSFSEFDSEENSQSTEDIVINEDIEKEVSKTENAEIEEDDNITIVDEEEDDDDGITMVEEEE